MRSTIRPGRVGDSRNGTSAKTVLTDIGAVDLAVLPDRNGTFEPKIVRKGQTGWPGQRADHRAVCAGRDDQHRVGVADRRAPAAATRHGWNPCSPDSVPSLAGTPVIVITLGSDD